MARMQSISVKSNTQHATKKAYPVVVLMAVHLCYPGRVTVKYLWSRFGATEEQEINSLDLCCMQFQEWSPSGMRKESMKPNCVRRVHLVFSVPYLSNQDILPRVRAKPVGKCGSTPKNRKGNQPGRGMGMPPVTTRSDTEWRILGKEPRKCSYSSQPPHHISI